MAIEVGQLYQIYCTNESGEELYLTSAEVGDQARLGSNYNNGGLSNVIQGWAVLGSLNGGYLFSYSYNGNTGKNPDNGVFLDTNLQDGVAPTCYGTLPNSTITYTINGDENGATILSSNGEYLNVSSDNKPVGGTVVQKWKFSKTTVGRKPI